MQFKRGASLDRKENPPYGWAIPGGFVDYGETVEEAAKGNYWKKQV